MTYPVSRMGPRVVVATTSGAGARLTTKRASRRDDEPAVTWHWDVEARVWDRPLCVVARSSAGDEEVWRGESSVAACGAFAQRVGGTWLAHYGGIYDVLLLTRTRSRPWQEIILSGSSVLSARDGALTMRDTGRWWLAGLKDIGEYLDKTREQSPADALDIQRFADIDDHAHTLAAAIKAARDGGPAPPGFWRKRDVDRGRLASLTEQEVVDYCRHDVAILVEARRRCREYLVSLDVDRETWTAGSTALAALRAIEPDSWSAMRAHRLPVEQAIGFDKVRLVRGGLVDCTARGEVTGSPHVVVRGTVHGVAFGAPRRGGVHCFDLRSAYPAAYAGDPIPLGARRATSAERGAPCTVWRVRWRWPYLDRLAPVYDQETGAGGGRCEAWCVPEEIALLVEAGVAVEYVEGWAPETIAWIGGDFAATMYAAKNAGAFFAKVILNSLHGQYSMRCIRERFTRGRPTEWYAAGGAPKLVPDGAPRSSQYWRFLVDTADRDGICPANINPLAAATILGRVRARISRIALGIERGGGRVYYRDTDSVHTDQAPDVVGKLHRIGDAMGDLAYEGRFARALYLGRKSYLLLDGLNQKGAVPVKGALKGAPLKALKSSLTERREIGGRKVDVYREARDEEKGADHREAFFRRSLAEGAVYVERDGIASFLTALSGISNARMGERHRVVRRISPTDGAKRWDGGAWRHMTPTEVDATCARLDDDDAADVPHEGDEE